jgi:hypothetical protein
MPDTVEDMLPDLNSRIFLPGLQREFVWNPSQIEMLFDSLMRDYPIGVLIKWNVRRAREDYYAYEFIQNYIADSGRVPQALKDEGYIRNNDRAEDADDADALIIDGQQRLNSLFIGLFGSIVTYTGGTGNTRDEAQYWDEKELCVNLLAHPEHDDNEFVGNFEFEFKQTDKLSDNDRFGYERSQGVHKFWYPIPNLIADDGMVRRQQNSRDHTREEVDSASIDVDASTREKFRQATLLVIDSFYQNVLNAELSTTEVKHKTEDIKEIFQRINIQGSEPRPYQLMLSRLMSTWPYVSDGAFNPRNKVEQWSEQFKHDYPEYETEIDRDMFMRYSYYLIDGDLAGKSSVNDLSEQDIEEMRKKWIGSPESVTTANFEWFTTGLRRAFETLTGIGFSNRTMDSVPYVTLLAKFFYENPAADEHDPELRNDVFKFFSLLLLLNESHGLLRRTKARNMIPVLAENRGGYDLFPALDLFSTLNVSPASEDIQRVVNNARYNPNAPGTVTFTSGYVAAVLGLIDDVFEQEDISDYDVDHIFPASRADEVSEAVDEDVDIHRIGNLQLLDSVVNRRQKGTKMPKKWMDDVLGSAQVDHYREVNCYPDVSLDPENYQEFVEQREQLLVEELKNRYVT